MSFISDAELAEDHFFGALLAGDAASLDTVLADDFHTEMAGAFGGVGFAASSRYTHVLMSDGDGRWRLATAQGTSIAESR
jgi:hypothetical protein